MMRKASSLNTPSKFPTKMAKIVNFRRARRHTEGNHMVIFIDGVKTKEEASKLVGKVVTYQTGSKNGNTIKGKVSAAHGNKGAVRAIFEKGMPGQSIGKDVDVK